MSKPTPKYKTMHVLRASGFYCDDSEKRLPIPGRFVTKDLFGLMDIVAFSPAWRGVFGVQVTTKNCLRDHIAKYEGMELKRVLKAFVDCENRFIMVVWHKTKTKGVHYELYQAKFEKGELTWLKKEPSEIGLCEHIP